MAAKRTPAKKPAKRTATRTRLKRDTNLESELARKASAASAVNDLRILPKERLDQLQAIIASLNTVYPSFSQILTPDKLVEIFGVGIPDMAGCTGCDYCQSCFSCQSCNTCQGCNTCQSCQSCNTCQKDCSTCQRSNSGFIDPLDLVGNPVDWVSRVQLQKIVEYLSTHF